MKKYLAPILTIAIVAALAGVLYIRANVERTAPVEFDEEEIVATAGPAVQYIVRSADGDATLVEYFLSSGTTENLGDPSKGPGPARFNQSSDICDTADGFTALTVRCEHLEDNILELNAIDGVEMDAKTVLATTFDMATLGFDTASEGYLVPVAVAGDKSAIYLARRVETESYVAGLWKLDVATGEVSEIEYVREHDIYEYDINVNAKKLFGISYTPPESLGEPPTHSEQYWVDLATGAGYGGESSIGAWGNPMLGDDGEAYAFYSSGESAQEGTTVFQAGEGTYFGGSFFKGVMKDWFGDTVVFDRDGNLFLYDLKTETETQITSETDATVEYIGVVE